jgi:hypothetical protein
MVGNQGKVENNGAICPVTEVWNWAGTAALDPRWGDRADRQIRWVS